MAIFLGIIKYICAVIAIFSTYMFCNSIISSYISGPAFFNTKEDLADRDDLRDAGWRIIFAAAGALTWAAVIVL